MLLFAACLSLMDVRSAECNVACKNWGFDQGRYVESHNPDGSASAKEQNCECADLRSYGLLHEKRMVLPRKQAKPRHSRWPDMGDD